MAKSKKKKAGLATGIIALAIVIGAGGYFLGTSNQKPTGEPELSQQEKEIQENLSNKEKQAEEATVAPSTNNSNTNSQATTNTLTSLKDANITAMKAGETVYLSVFGIPAGTYEVDKNGKKMELADANYIGSGGLVLPTTSTAEKSATYQVFAVANGKRAVSSSVITVTTAFEGTKTFTGK